MMRLDRSVLAADQAARDVTRQKKAAVQAASSFFAASNLGSLPAPVFRSVGTTACGTRTTIIVAPGTGGIVAARTCIRAVGIRSAEWRGRDGTGRIDSAGRNCTSGIDRTGRQTGAGSNGVGTIALRRPPVASMRNIGNSLWRRRAAVFRLRALDRQRDAALLRPPGRE